MVLDEQTMRGVYMNGYDFWIAKYYITHSIIRAEERYKIILDENHMCEIADMILSGKAILKKRQSLARSIYKLKYEGKNLVVVFDFNQQLPVTILPHKALAKMSQYEELLAA
jgi:hypothetical protein